MQILYVGEHFMLSEINTYITGTPDQYVFIYYITTHNMIPNFKWYWQPTTKAYYNSHGKMEGDGSIELQVYFNLKDPPGTLLGPFEPGTLLIYSKKEFNSYSKKTTNDYPSYWDF